MDINQDLTERADPNIVQHIGDLNSQTGSQVAAGYEDSAPQARGLLQAHDNFQGNMGFGDSGTMAAIKQRANQQYGIMEKQTNLNILRQADADHLGALRQASDAANQEVLENKQKALIKFQIDQANRRARGQVLGSVLGIVGGIVGGVAGGYATAGTGTAAGAAGGAAAGYQLGSGLGQSIGMN